MGLGALPSGVSQFPAAALDIPQVPLLTAPFPRPRSLLALLWHHTLAVLTAAAGPQTSSTQRYKKLQCALKVPGT